MKREPRLQFSDADLAEPKLEKPIKRVKKAAAKADKAQAKIPKKTVVKKERGFDPATGKVKTQLRFEEVDKKKPPSKLTHAVRDAPANFVLSQVHREVRQSEDDNVGVEAAHKVEQAVESGGRLVQSAHRAHQLKPYRAAIRAERKLEQANIDALQKKAEIDSPTSNPVSKWQQKQAIKKQYAAAKHNQAAQTTAKAAENTAKAAKKAAEKAEKAGKYVWEHRRGFAIAAAILLMLAFLLNGLSSCSVMMDGVGSGIAASTYPSQDADMLGAEAQYCEMEAELQRYLDTYESTHDYDEYHFDLDTIEHDPYVLISMITALHQGEWTLDEVQGTGAREVRSMIFYAPGEGTLLYPGLRAEDHLKMVCDMWPHARDIEEIVEQTQIGEFARMRIRTLSQGMKQQLTLAIAYATGARYLLLDEPMNALDPSRVDLHSEILRKLADSGTCIIMSSHILDSVDRLCDEILFLKDGRLIRSIPQDDAAPKSPGSHFAKPAGRAEGALSTYRRLYEKGG